MALESGAYIVNSAEVLAHSSLDAASSATKLNDYVGMAGIR